MAMLTLSVKWAAGQNWPAGIRSRTVYDTREEAEAQFGPEDKHGAPTIWSLLVAEQYGERFIIAENAYGPKFVGPGRVTAASALNVLAGR